MKSKLLKTFQESFHRLDGDVYYSPGRVNLIGEHIDYNGGFVLPCALSYGTYGVVGKRSDDFICVLSPSFSKEIYCFNRYELKKEQEHAWSNYMKGSIKALEDHGYHLSHGFDLYIEGNMPVNAGLSSSASLEILMITLLDNMFQFKLTMEQKAKLGQYAENNFVGVNSGIMDQFAVVAGKKDHAILLNTHDLTYQYIPLHLNSYQLLIVNSNKKRGLADSKYNERFKECQDSLKELKKHMMIHQLCDLSDDQLKASESYLSPVQLRRVRHVQTEQQRTLASCEALKKGDIHAFAKLMIASHESLKSDYEVTGIELDTLVQILLDEGALGARMTGAGFGGCVVSIVKKEDVETMKKRVRDEYTRIIGYEPSFYEVLPSDGASPL